MKTMLKIGVGVTFVLLLLGCQLTRGPTDEMLISEFLNTFKESVETQDMDRLMSVFSDSIEVAGQVIDKQGLRAAMEAGGLDNVEVSIDDSKSVINDDGTATVSLGIAAPMGNITEKFTLYKEGDAWLISVIEIIL